MNTQAEYQTDLLFDIESMTLAAEAVLFACGDPVSFDRLAESIGAPVDKIPFVLARLKDSYETRNTAIRVLILDTHAQLVTKGEYAEVVRCALQLRKNQPLSRAALEVLAIAACHQPVTRAFIDRVRGVESPSVLLSLCEKGLLEEKGRLDAPGRPLLYGTTPIFLRTFGLASVESILELPALREMLRQTYEDEYELQPDPQSDNDGSADERETAKTEVTE